MVIQSPLYLNLAVKYKEKNRIYIENVQLIRKKQNQKKEKKWVFIFNTRQAFSLGHQGE